MFEVFNQPYDGTLEREILDFIAQNKDIEEIFIFAAYAKVSGVRKLSPHFKNLLEQSCQINICVGIDQQNTSSEALQELLTCTSNLYVYHNENLTVTTHPKLYYLRTSDSHMLFIGSNNLTGGGLETNDEVFTKASELTEEVLIRVNSIYSRYTDITSNFCIEINNEIIQELLENDYILNESQINNQLRRPSSQTNQSSSDRSTRNNLFGSESRRSTTSRRSSSTNERSQYSMTEHNTSQEFLEENFDTHILEQDVLDLLDEIESYDTIYENGYETFIAEITATNGYYHIPQGVHLGHLFYIIKAIGDSTNNHLDYRLTIFNERTTGDNGNLVRQTRYKLALAMELLLIEDIRLHDPQQGDFGWNLTNNGRILYDLLNNYVLNPNQFYNFEDNNVTSWRMENSKDFYKEFVINLPTDVKEVFFRLFNNLQFFERTTQCIINLPVDTIDLNYFYNDLWNEHIILELLSIIDIRVPSLSSLQHRIPFLIDLLETFNIISPIEGTNSYSITR